ncbi:alpha/beta hydrolase [Saccharothrix violaceirubra]|uniref:Pimeloyl-ACP methyl ester carboxylesterase n=1 Tax=Saccharothrix violaceirubra TaxID=413306 RepID=A0A7W7WTY6_9PSEU|nr:alpha/beta hydrolase [Saccharothrix violaceirubra]MBB4963631.1 pimeloyl-ACP methyl ester carboxylesterase [Saccharothrix violaceirubra]
MRKLVVAVSALALVASVPAVADAAPEAVKAAKQFDDQKLAWGPCTDIPNAPPLLECATFGAPRDWNRPNDGNKITIAISRLKPKGPTKSSVLTNPGGPGAPGREFALAFASRTKLVDNAEVIGIDVRGTGASTNVTCGDFDSSNLVDPRDRSPRNVKLFYDAAEFQATTCQTLSGDFGKYVNTEQTVKDLDLLRRLLKRDKISWVGYSGGTWMGAYYATYFPERVDKFVLDSNAEFTTTFQDVFDEFGRGFERRFRTDFLPWVAKYDNVFHLGTTAEAVRQQYEKARAALTANPIPLPDGSHLKAVHLDSLLVQVQYSKNYFQIGAEFLAAVASGAVPATTANAALGLTQYRDASSATFYAIACNDTRYLGGRKYLAEKAERLGAQYPLIGYYQIDAACAFWERPALQLKKPTGKGVPPILMVQSERDPATPVEGARRSHEKFAGSRLLTVTDEGDHGIYAFGNKCVDDIVEAFLVDAKVPDKDLTCAGVPLPDPTAPQAKADDTVRRPIFFPL